MRRECCYHNYPREGVVHIGVNGGVSHWICFRPPPKSGTPTTTASLLMAAGAKCRNSASCCAASAQQKNFDAGNRATVSSSSTFPPKFTRLVPIAFRILL